MQDKNFDSDLWQAWRYVAGEMDERQSRDYEQRLATDQAAREAVAEAVDLQQLVGAAETELASTSQAPRIDADAGSRRWVRRAGWLVMGAAASLLAVMTIDGWRLGTSSQPPAKDTVLPDTSVHSALALVWSETRADWPEMAGEMADAPAPLDAQGTPAGFSPDAEQESLAAMAADSEDLSVPDWMLRALELSREGEPSGESTDEGEI